MQKTWKWGIVPGMLLHTNQDKQVRVLSIDEAGKVLASDGCLHSGGYPVLEDPATFGICLDIARARAQDASVSITHSARGGWYIQAQEYPYYLSRTYSTEGEALEGFLRCTGPDPFILVVGDDEEFTDRYEEILEARYSVISMSYVEDVVEIFTPSTPTAMPVIYVVRDMEAQELDSALPEVGRSRTLTIVKGDGGKKYRRALPEEASEEQLFAAIEKIVEETA